MTYNWERNAIVQLAEALDIIVASWILAGKLVAWEGKKFDIVTVLCLHLLVQGLETAELWGEAAFGRSINDKDDFVLVVGQGDWLALLCRITVSLHIQRNMLGKRGVVIGRG